jgi:hypothetical protein
MLDSHYHPVARINTEVNESRNTFYAISLRHLWLGYGFCLCLEFVELTFGQEDSVDVFLRCIACVGRVGSSSNLKKLPRLEV